MIIFDFNIKYFNRTESFSRPESFFPSKNHFIDPFTLGAWPGTWAVRNAPTMVENLKKKKKLKKLKKLGRGWSKMTFDTS